MLSLSPQQIAIVGGVEFERILPPIDSVSGNSFFTLNSQQIETFERAEFDRMLLQIESAMANIFPETCAVPLVEGEASKLRITNDQCKSFVENGIERGVELGMQSKSDLAVFIALDLEMLTLSEKSIKWINDWLTKADTTGAIKLAMIEAQLDQRALDAPELKTISQRIKIMRREMER